MKTYKNPKKNEWEKLIQRPVLNQNKLSQKVRSIITDVAQNGDAALLEYTRQFDKVKLNQLAVTKQEVKAAKAQISAELKAAIDVAYSNIYTFHKAQETKEEVIETSPGVKCWRKSVAIEKVGLYIPGGSAPLFSTILMLGIPAKIAGCKEIIMCSPPDKNGTINAAILYTANLVGIKKIYKVGGAQAIAAMSLGTASIPEIYKIFGPGNQFVTKAKELVQQSGTAIDMPAGPSEVLIIADHTCNPSFVAADLLSQAEHGPDSQVILLTNNAKTLASCLKEVRKQVEVLPRKATVQKALKNSKAIVLNKLDQCFNFSNAYAPEHLIIASNKASEYAGKIINAGSVFLGNYSCESAGDYASGTNHTLPTNGFARNYSGVSLDSFLKKITFQKITKKGINSIGKSIEIMAEAEELFAHKNAVSIRLKTVNND